MGSNKMETLVKGNSVVCRCKNALPKTIIGKIGKIASNELAGGFFVISFEGITSALHRKQIKKK